MDNLYNDYLAHHGILGQKWGVRRFQNPDGTLTNAGRKRLNRKFVKSYNEASNHMNRDALRSINEKYKNEDLGANNTKLFSTKAGQKYVKEIDKEWRSSYASALKKNNPELFYSGERWLSEAPFMDMYADYIYDK